MNKFVSLSIAITASTLTIGTAPVYAADSDLDFSQMFVFGDSLSDPGNTNGTGNADIYFEGRASNGNVFTDIVASHLELDPLTFYKPNRGGARSDGANFAKGGNNSGDNGLGKQLNSFLGYLEGESANSNALYTLWIGSTDYLSGTKDYIAGNSPDIVDTTVENVIDGIRDLYNVGARDFLIPNLLSFTNSDFHKIQGIDEKIFNQLTDDHNQKLELEIAEFEEEFSEVTITLLDVNSTFDNILENPGEFGFTNVTDSWLECDNKFRCDVNLADPAAPDGNLSDENLSDGYLYWDYIHPTTKFYQLIANEAISALNSEYNQAVPENNQAVPEYSQDVPEPTSILSLLGLGLSFLGTSAFKQKDKQKQKQKV
ncbi:MAG: SGNH/GDSL hydrolase family protein [Okeania sp. SIO2F4]|uniref:SGNH/GDSL hydrolase family protein n=1 Tax=Okeania sp. SIO2F4 TaxID=2607790 RepID=UPI00142C6517|nr:SGNH/GDSL hydrolase family protein [Okeania sp. SIO2F4]NES01382.1 SGNH/GDSL hydrolase family protein [Okeania sp. SIO2F4]